ncbi:GD19476 [Drosophila simulans]|uniref:GD19476 n=1 Tax=Drosophila simulans TaxID=7240 RepID=B4NVH5_DROSI|nr:GD19476 [Drosophila simulans]
MKKSNRQDHQLKDELKMPASRNTMSSQERTQNIKRVVMEDELTLCEEEEEPAANDSLTAATELADQSIIEDVFGEDILMKEWQLENAVQPTCSIFAMNMNTDIVSCPICFEKMKRIQLAYQLDGG